MARVELRPALQKTQANIRNFFVCGHSGEPGTKNSAGTTNNEGMPACWFTRQAWQADYGSLQQRRGNFFNIHTSASWEESRQGIGYCYFCAGISFAAN